MPPASKQFEQLDMFPDHKFEEQPLWRMSPTQFENHPQTVFHASYRALPPRGERLDIETANGGIRHTGSDYPGLHAGTEQAALERATTVASRPYEDSVLMQDMTRFTPDDVKAARADHTDPREVSRPSLVMHPLNVSDRPPSEGLGSVEYPMSDPDANDAAAWPTRRGPMIYENTSEDKKSLSVVFPQLGTVSHSDYVDAALARGESKSKLHPLTRHLYETGRLDNFRHITQEDMDQVRSHDEQHRDAHNEGLFPFEAVPQMPKVNLSGRSYTAGQFENARLLSREEVFHGAALDRSYAEDALQMVKNGVDHNSVRATGRDEDNKPVDTHAKIEQVLVPIGKRERVSTRGDLRRNT
jgi:hypothetical protein